MWYWLIPLLVLAALVAWPWLTETEDEREIRKHFKRVWRLNEEARKRMRQAP
jgi:ABC-type iron transport system FetAB ATPase subunit